jgi:phospholipid/cholesterol/gamma-HCH transport system substrate-binding protein
MPSQQEVKWSQLKVGLIVLVSIALLSTLLFLMTSSSGLSVFSHKIYVTAYFSNSNGLKVGAPVGLEGVTIGEVKAVTVSTDPARKLTPVKVMLKLDPKFHSSLHTDSRASLSTVGVLGDTIVDINSRTAVGPQLQTGDELQTLQTANLDDVVKASEGTIESLNLILSKVDSITTSIDNGSGSVGKFIKDPQLYDQAEATVTQLQTLTRNLNNGKGSMGKLIRDDQLYDRLNDTASKLDAITTALNEGKGTAGKLLKDDSLYNNLDSTLKHANSLLAEADAGKGALGLMVKDPAFASKLDHTVTQLDTLLTNVNTGKGTFGKLATDETAYANLNALLTSANGLVGDIRKDPKKYLVIRLKIF